MGARKRIRSDYPMPENPVRKPCEVCGKEVVWTVSVSSQLLPLDLSTGKYRKGRVHYENHQMHCQEPIGGRKVGP